MAKTAIVKTLWSSEGRSNRRGPGALAGARGSAPPSPPQAEAAAGLRLITKAVSKHLFFCVVLQQTCAVTLAPGALRLQARTLPSGPAWHAHGWLLLASDTRPPVPKAFCVITAALMYALTSVAPARLHALNAVARVVCAGDDAAFALYNLLRGGRSSAATVEPVSGYWGRGEKRPLASSTGRGLLLETRDRELTHRTHWISGEIVA